MSEGMLKMWISFAAMGLMALSILSIYFSRYKFKNRMLKFLTAFIAYICLIVGGLFMVYVVFSNPNG
ncbi:DUF2768 domain-containing protein [Falsibacillus albus]|uniref:DUF2768 domain-containing protein n=1 Tax=Falsibacillus albus TaxID=2478915 RepID=A0A3L7JY95_9BACI|nr:DUF2768 domain-containing protein [Falsibacillus albus]RLQ95089.1 DUF2768 domain-containing protein [Falsibacillus albus]